jgi:hypothetical protein
MAPAGAAGGPLARRAAASAARVAAAGLCAAAVLKAAQVAGGALASAALPEDAHELIRRAPKSGLRVLGAWRAAALVRGSTR